MALLAGGVKLVKPIHQRLAGFRCFDEINQLVLDVLTANDFEVEDRFGPFAKILFGGLSVGIGAAFNIRIKSGQAFLCLRTERLMTEHARIGISQLGRLQRWETLRPQNCAHYIRI
ncbi:hypothetical protein NS334_17450 [Sphingomonas endophytica]|uniref:Uncharacterized protein n=1 Tax=Sphingomonas endophytica TaxID=869719 RepID=A0A147HQQ1_9SPHN|nr:hypothetical protein NS334_17450 [Sphingomonas endophytica]